MRRRHLLFVLVAVLAGALAGAWEATPTQAQSQTVTCGSIVTGRFRLASQGDTYGLALKEGDKMNITARAVADTLTFAMIISDPVGRKYYEEGRQKELVYNSPTLSGDGVYTILIGNDYRGSGGLGTYTLSIGCVLADGTIIKPGDKPSAAQPTTKPGATAAPTTVPAAAAPTTVPTPTPFSGVGFPGLPSVDFGKGVELPLSVTAPFTATLKPGSTDVLSLPFDGKAGDTIALDFTRTAGNMNIGVALLAPDNSLMFHATLLGTDLVSTRLKLPTSGKYTLGVFRVGINEPASPVNTTFRVQVRVNPK